MTWVVSIILLAIYAYICQRSIREGLLVLVAALPLYLIKLSIGPVPTNLLELMFFVALIIWALGYMDEGRRESVVKMIKRYRLALSGMGLILVGAILGIFVSDDIPSSINAVKSFLVEPMLFAIMIWNVRKQEKFHISHFLIAFSIPVVIIGLVAIFQWLTGLGIPTAWIAEHRATSIFPYPNAVGHFVAPIVTIMVAMFVAGKVRVHPWQRHLMYSAIALGTIAMILSQTEAAWIAVMASLLVVSFFYKDGARRAVPAAIIGLVILLAIPSFRQIVIPKVTLQDWSGQTRIAQWVETKDFLLASPVNFIFGAGPNNYPTAIEPFHKHSHLEIFQQPHNIILNVWVEYGLIGLVGFLIVAFCVIRGSRRDRRKEYVVPLAAALLTMVIHGLVDVPYFKNDLSMLTWTIIALLMIAVARKKRVELLAEVDPLAEEL